ncbi:hypothetical protein KCU73_g9199, partial [Aureobasidium melanogenum]
MGFFTADRCIEEYAEMIWNVEPQKIKQNADPARHASLDQSKNFGPSTTLFLGSSTERYGAQEDKKEVNQFLGIAEGGARTRDLEVVLYLMIRATRSTD